METKFILSDFFNVYYLNDRISNFVEHVFKIFPDNIGAEIDYFSSLLRDDLVCYMEYPYVEKVYRDSFYHYYSTKHNSKIRDCARISFFEPSIKLSDFRKKDSFSLIKKSFLGYITIRPTYPNLVGRTMLSPSVYKSNNNLYCLTENEVEINGIKLSITGFPHSSQDTETITCAETTIWALMEYFGTKYPEYKPVLPSQIISALSKVSNERQLPSHGLATEQISFVLKEFGFGTRIYATYNSQCNTDNVYDPSEHKRMLGYYIESGIPVIAGISNDKIGHAIIYMGRKVIDYESINLNKYKPYTLKIGIKSIKIYDHADFIDQFIVIDDNMPPYSSVTYDNPTINYSDKQFEHCKVNTFIAPLYHKIYMEAGGARELVFHSIIKICKDWIENNSIIQLFCMSSRSLKSEINKNIGLNEEATNLILSLTMPKFVWVCTVTNLALLKQNKAKGLILIDATETNRVDSIILILSSNGVTLYNVQNKPKEKYEQYDFSIDIFNTFANNLKNK